MRVVLCPYCSHEYDVDDSWMKDDLGLIHECSNCENEYLVTKNNVSKR